MNHLLPRALPSRSQTVFRSAIQAQLSSGPLRNLFLPAIQIAALSVKSSPTSPRLPLNKSLKIPPSQRPLSRPLAPPPTKTDAELASLTYVVRRTPSAQLPVYRKWMSGGNRQVILIKKIDGDRRRMLEDLIEDVGIAKEDVRINPTTQHVEIKGHYFDKVGAWLLERGF